jgi:hypothetical protein
LGQFKEALYDYEIAMRINPQFPYLKGVRLATKMRICDWANFEEDSLDLEQCINNYQKVSQPFWIFCRSRDLEKPLYNTASLSISDWAITSFCKIVTPFWRLIITKTLSNIYC